MRLFDLHRLFLNCCSGIHTANRFALGFASNLIVASSYVLAWWWFDFLSKGLPLDNVLGKVAAVSIVISTSSLVLCSHRFIAGIAIYFKQALFLSDPNFEVSNEFDLFLKSPARAHILGAMVFILFQAVVGGFVSLIF